jgi:polysaccharide export outer membrane protein
MQTQHNFISSGRLQRLAAVVLAMFVGNVAMAAEVLLGPGDMVRVMVVENQELTTEARVSQAGTLGLPLLGEVAIAGRTPGDAATLIAERLRKGKLILDPHVSVSLVEAHSQRVQVLGHVARPGQYALDGSNGHLSDVLAMAGGRSEDGSDRVVVTRRDGKTHREIDVARMYQYGDLADDMELQPGDVVFVPAAPVFYVYGAVQRAGVYRLEPQTSVRAALSIGGGLTTRGTQSGIKIHRRMPDGSIRDLSARLTDAIEPNDVIYVRESFF